MNGLLDTVRRGLRLPLLVSIGLVSWSIAGEVRADGHDLGVSAPRLEVKPDGGWSYDPNARMTGKELGTIIEDAIGKDNYQSINVILNTCHSAAGIGTVQSGLSGSNQVIATCGAGQTTRITRQKSDDSLTGFLPSFFDSIDKDPEKPVDDHIDEGNKGESRLPKTPEEEEAKKKKHERYRQRVIEYNKKRVAEGKKPRKVPLPWDSGGRDESIQEPETAETADDPSSKKIASGTNSNHAIIFRTIAGKTSEIEVEQAKNALKKAGYDTVSVMTPVNAADVAKIDSDAAAGKTPSIRDDASTPQNLKKALEDLHDTMGDDETLTVVVIGHGTEIRQSVKTSSNSGMDGGASFSQLAATDHIGAHEIGSLLGEEVVLADGSFLFDDYRRTRWDAPALAIQTVDEFSDNDAGVGVYVNGVFIGDMTLGQAELGDPIGYHFLTFSDAVIEQIIDTTDFTSGLDVSFQFASANDFFKLATQEDLSGIANGWGHGYAGMNMVFGLDGDDAAVVPLPGGLVLLLTGLAGLGGIGAARRQINKS